MFRDFKGIDYAQKLSASTNSLYNSLSGERSIIYYSFKIIYDVIILHIIYVVH